MSSIPGARLDIIGTTGSSGALTPKSGWKAYVLPRGGHAAQDSSGTTVTFDSAAIASRFAALDWIQAGLLTANIRQVAAVGGNSLTVTGAALTITENQRIYVIGRTEPTIMGGSATYTTPATFIRQRDDDAADLYTNSMVTSNADGLIQFWGGPAVFDVLVQDGNNSLQGSIIDLAVGAVEGISTSMVSLFGATVTINANVGVTGSLVLSGTLLVGQTSTVNGAFGATGWATFGATVTMNANAGVTGALTVGATLTVIGPTVLGQTGIIGGLSVTTGIFGCTNQPRCSLTRSAVTGQSFTGSSSILVLWDAETFDVGGFFSVAGNSTRMTIPAGHGGGYLVHSQLTWQGVVGATGYRAIDLKKNGSRIALTINAVSLDNSGSQSVQVNAIDVASPADYYEIGGFHTQGSTMTLSAGGRGENHFQLVKLF